MEDYGYYLDLARFPNAREPVRADHDGDIGYDLFAAEDTFVPHILGEETVLIPTGVSFKFPPGVAGILTDRSSTFLKRGLLLKEGKIDNKYRTPVAIMARSLDNHVTSVEPAQGGQWVKAGEKIAQIYFIDIHPWRPERLSEKPEEVRGGFGSTGR